MEDNNITWKATFVNGTTIRCLHCRRKVASEICLQYLDLDNGVPDSEVKNFDGSYHLNCVLKLKDLIFKLGLKTTITQQSHFPPKLYSTLLEFQDFMTKNVNIIEYHIQGYDWAIKKSMKQQFLDLLDKIRIADK